MFMCPTCQTRLSRMKSAAGIFYICGSCGGRTVTVELLRKTVPNETINFLWQEAMASRGAPKRRCPSCSFLMNEVAVKSTSREVYLDVCTKCRFVWFDKSEYELIAQIMKETPAKSLQNMLQPKSQMSQEAKERLGEIKIKQIHEQAHNQVTAHQPPDQLWKYLPAVFGMPVEYDNGGLQRKPWVTWLLTAMISLISVLAFNDLINVVTKYGLIPADYGRYSGLTFFTSFFLHGGVLHLVGNMYFLLVFGDNVEEVLGGWKYLRLLFLAAFAGGIAHILAEPSSTIPCIGASGGISGIIVFYAFKFPKARLGILFYFRWVRMPASVMLLLWIVLQIYGVYLQTRGHSSVSSLAHLGGAATGFLAYLM